MIGIVMANHNEFLQTLWSLLESEMNVSKECDVYSYLNDLDSDPFAEEGAIWSFNYFFFNK